MPIEFSKYFNASDGKKHTWLTNIGGIQLLTYRDFFPSSQDFCSGQSVNGIVRSAPADVIFDSNYGGQQYVTVPLYNSSGTAQYWFYVRCNKTSWGGITYGCGVARDPYLNNAVNDYSQTVDASGSNLRYVNAKFIGMQDEDGNYIVTGCYLELSQYSGIFVNSWNFFSGIRTQNFKNHYSVEFQYSTEFSPQAGEMSGEGGYSGGTFDDTSDTIAIPTAPTLGVTSAGFINVYSPTAGELTQFGAELFPNLNFTPVSQGSTPSNVTDAVVAMAQVLVDFGNQIPALIDMYINANLIQYVIDCHLIPVAPTTGGTSALKVGFKTFTQTPLSVTSDYVDFDCGSLNVGEYYANFVDYAPYTSAKLYLPFVGFMDIAPEYWQSGILQVVYRFNVIDGSFVAYVKSTSSKSKLSDTVIAQFGGNACVHIPITGLNYANMVSGIVSAVSPLLPSAKSNVGTVDKLVNSANTIASAKPAIQQSNGYNATTSFLTVRTPYLLIERSVSNFSRKYDSENGIPSNITLDFSTLSGFTKATMLHLDGIAGATEDDLDEIASLLAEGVIL